MTSENTFFQQNWQKNYLSVPQGARIYKCYNEIDNISIEFGEFEGNIYVIDINKDYKQIQDKYVCDIMMQIGHKKVPFNTRKAIEYFLTENTWPRTFLNGDLQGSDFIPSLILYLANKNSLCQLLSYIDEDAE